MIKCLCLLVAFVLGEIFGVSLYFKDNEEQKRKNKHKYIK